MKEVEKKFQSIIEGLRIKPTEPELKTLRIMYFAAVLEGLNFARNEWSDAKINEFLSVFGTLLNVMDKNDMSFAVEVLHEIVKEGEDHE